MKKVMLACALLALSSTAQGQTSPTISLQRLNEIQKQADGICARTYEESKDAAEISARLSQHSSMMGLTPTERFALLGFCIQYAKGWVNGAERAAAQITALGAKHALEPLSVPSEGENEDADLTSIPQVFRGNWAPVGKDCRSDFDGPIEIKSSSIRFHEGIAQISRVTRSGSDVTVVGTFTYEDTEPYRATLRREGDLMVKIGDFSPNGDFDWDRKAIFKRC